MGGARGARVSLTSSIPALAKRKMFAKTRSARIATIVTTKMTAMQVRSTRSSTKLQSTAKITAQKGAGWAEWEGAQGSGAQTGGRARGYLR